MSVVKCTNRRAFTLIELLVVVAIIALLISILLPSLSCAREKARAAKCGVTLRGFGGGLAAYGAENNEWIPGVNTSGVEVTVAKAQRDINALRRASMPVQSYDWMSPFLSHETELGNNRAERFRTLINVYGCASLAADKVNQPYPPNPGSMVDGVDFTMEIVMNYAPLSYLMPAEFQWWGQDWSGSAVAYYISGAGRLNPIRAAVTPQSFEAIPPGAYQSRLGMVGPPARKVAAADGLRFMDESLNIDFDVDPAPTWFGAFTSSGAWWAGSTEYGVQSGTSNWDGTIVNQPGSDPPARGRNLAWSYRHGCAGRDTVTQSVHNNPGEINALFFDGHVARLDDHASRKIDYWYPTGSIVQKPTEGLTDVPENFEVP